MVSSITAVSAPKVCEPDHKNWFYKKMTKNKCNREFYYEFYLLLSFFHIHKFKDLIHTLLDLKQLFLRIPLNFPYGVIIFTLINIEIQKSQWSSCLIASYNFDQYMAFQWPLWPLNLNGWLFPLNSLQMIQTRGKIIKKSNFWIMVFDFTSKKFLRLFYCYWRFLMPNKSTSMKKYISE